MKTAMMTFVWALVLLAASGTAVAQPPPDYDFDFVTIGSPGNAPFQGPVPFGWTAPLARGAVPYEYRAARMEITTAQWAEFLNVFAPFGAAAGFNTNNAPVYWGAVHDRLLPNGRWMYRVHDRAPDCGLFPVGSISWRDAARYLNWLHHGKLADPSTLITGAYDTTTFGARPDGSITDAPTRLPGARYFIPTFDEQLKAAHYDPNRFGEGLGGWWRYKNMSDGPGTPGLPGVGTTSAGLILDGNPTAAWDLPLGAYPGSLSPWGLLDTSGGAMEWNEWLFTRERGRFGSRAGGDPSSLQNFEAIWGFGTSDAASGSIIVGLRVYSTVPCPSQFIVLVGGCFLFSRRRS